MIEKLRIPVSRIFVILLIITIIVSESGWNDKTDLMGTILFLTGAVLVGIASMGRLWCSLYIAGYKTEKLITEGPYSMCRNPLYFFSFLGAIGVGLASETLLIPVFILFGFALYYPFVIRSEETELKKIFNDQFHCYAKDVPRFFPNLSKLKEPEDYIVKPKVFKKHLFDALWFIWLIGIMELIETLHELNYLPVLFKIY